MFVRHFSFPRLLVAALLAASAGRPAHAQKAPRVATRVDSLRAARNAPIAFVPVVFTMVSGKQVRGYVTGYDLFTHDKVMCYELPPNQLPPPPLKEMAVERIRTMQVEGRTLDALSKNGKPLGLLAENMTPAGASKIYGYSVTKADMYIPIPLAFGAMLIPLGSHDKYFWFVRPAGGEVQEVPRGDKAFAKLMAAAFADYPALAARVQQQTPDASYKNMPQLVQEYNAHFAAAGK